MKCKCQSDSFSYVTSGPHIKVICQRCQEFVTFISKPQFELLDIQLKETKTTSLF